MDRRLRGMLIATVLVGIVGVAGVVLLVVYGPSLLPPDPSTQVSVPVPHPQATGPEGRRPLVASSARLPGQPQPAREARRLPVAGAEGYYVVINPGGESYLEGPDGKRTVLVEANPPPTAGQQQVEQRLAERLAAIARERASRKNEPGRLVVLDEGVVEIPLTAVVTLQTRDKLVTANADGSSTVYYANGRVEQRETRAKPPEPSPAPPPGP